MSADMVEPRRPGDTDLHRRQRAKNLITVGLLLLLAVGFFALTIVRMGGKG
jgi:hypothetical protein